MSPITILLTVAAYFVVLFALSFYASRKADNASFFTGNRQSHWYMVAFAMIGASISGVTFVSVPGMVATSGFGYLQLFMGFIVGQLIIAFILTPMYYRMHLTSVYEYLSNRFGTSSYHTGAWFFFLSKMLGAAVRLMLVCITLQILVGDPLGIPFIVNVAASMLIVWLYTFRGGVKSIIWADSLKTLCLIVSVVLCICFIASDMHLGFSGMMKAINESNMSRVFFFDDVNNKQYFFKQFLAGIFTMVATNGLDQDMMQRNLSCRNPREAQKNMVMSILLQFIVVWTFLMLGVLLYLFASRHGISATGDQLFPVIATGNYLPAIVGILFIIGFVAAAYNAAGSALTALTTSFTVDILGAGNQDETSLKRTRLKVHGAMAVLMGVVIVIIQMLNNTSVIDAVYVLASYTYGPLLGMFAFGMLLKAPVRDRLVPVVAIVSPSLCLILDKNSEAWFGGYHFSYEILILNALFTFIGLWLIRRPKDSAKRPVTRVATIVVLLMLAVPATAQPLERVTPEQVGLSSEGLKNADAAIKAAIREGRAPGAVLAVVRHGKMAYLKAFGNRSVYPKKEAMTVNTVFDLASCSKPLGTALSMMQLLETGRVRLMDAVKTYIPNFRSWRGADGDTVTIRVLHLLTHTSGLPPYAPVEELKQKYGSPCPEALMDYIATCKRDFRPETAMQYSCINYVTLQHIIEGVTGESLRDYAARHIFVPLGMAHTDYLPCRQAADGRWVNTDQPRWMKKDLTPDADAPIAPTERQKDGSVLRGQVHDPLARVLNGGISGNAGLFSTADDIAILCAMILNGGEWNGHRILGPLTVKAMRTVPRQVEQQGRCLGWDVHSAYASCNGDLLSAETFGHTGYTGTSVVIDPVNDVAIILLTNAVHPVDKTNVIRLRGLVSNAVAGSIK